MIFNIIGILIGFIIFCGGMYYFIKEKQDKQSQKIYSGFSLAGAAILIAMIIKIMLSL